MSVTSIEAVSYLFDVLKTTVILSDPKKINGSLYEFHRPLNSVVEDVVIGSLDMGREAVQKGILNVNVFVPNKPITIGVVTDYSQPNKTRLKELAVLTDIALGKGEEIWNSDGTVCFKIQQDNSFPDENNQHYLNFRVEFYSIN